MARKTIIEYVDDTDDTRSADETVEFGIDGVTYEIDLATVNADKLRADINKWVESARRVSGRSRRGNGRRSTPKIDREQTAAIREWASKNGHKVSTRGRVPSGIVDAYNAASGAQVTAEITDKLNGLAEEKPPARTRRTKATANAGGETKDS
ncbi:Protein lsr2 precursor [Mycobacteroides abscessus subsp. abscessus]|nr:Protein lsr2 precursor [Mycobacteroides abscessus subsp. abscessus]SHY64299.1 Protein lsr2 precursor [Mycobacteroides abscessus subsp. abscessus]SHY74862.1 Protein lsr2 precursor [Mycobacteroides abscessus subsp. abscessus]SIA14071.1 Protein lsr2 precursor [Mycobacteroides abscessus subsp. abscessus]SIB18989.1 protein lsr2 [Mycobacteroides abscessus subsp. abscessus]